MISDYYTESAVLQVLTTSTGWGGEESYTDSSTIACAINPIAGLERIAADRKTLFADYKLFCSDTVSVDETYRLTWSENTFDVMFVKDTLNMGHHKKILLKMRTL